MHTSHASLSSTREAAYTLSSAQKYLPRFSSLVAVSCARTWLVKWNLQNEVVKVENRLYRTAVVSMAYNGCTFCPLDKYV